ncbi:nicotinamide mononucleotide transporter [Pseudomonas sp.]|uniref:nicotinamide mononucleotide transporter n=1 Tax=Pseudomonas sp. TaxID=306 RepID=UPI002913DEF8|nr:nicotinamide mononucleotide transporter [Pseudomonas sp.]MDU4254590.1 nicotinamide mononucleotide transporter [Pseudomonas sp.]
MLTIVEWIGTLFGIAGAVLLSCNIKQSPWGWWLFLVSSTSICAFAVMTSAWGLLLLNACFVGTNINGILRWWWPARKAGAAANQSSPATLELP